MVFFSGCGRLRQLHPMSPDSNFQPMVLKVRIRHMSMGSSLIFVDPVLAWPPPDPDRIPRQMRQPDESQNSMYEHSTSWSQDQIEAFRRRQQEDFKRFDNEASPIIRRKPFHQRHAAEEHQSQSPSRVSISSDYTGAGEETWRDTAGDRLNDFGVDETIEFYDEDDMPLAMLLERNDPK